MSIKVLEKSICELIAAGEVVERPASVVKELVENAIDAHSKIIEVELRQNGLDLIRVTDNGVGIAHDEVKVAFLRHATSKISQTNDLDAISTLGFRGEALAAICAVSRVRLVTRTDMSENAIVYRIEAGEEQGLDEIGAPCGSSIYVSDIFYNTPARMKFLKKDVYEGNAVQNIVEQLALSHPEIAFKLIRDGRVAFSTPGKGDLQSAAFCVLPREIATNMLEIQPIDAKIKISGIISKPQQARPSRSLQFVFINNRYVKSRGICAAAEEACRNLIMVGKHPAFVINVELPCEDVDINVHPAKTEVRFKNEREVNSNVYAAIKLVLNEFASGFNTKTEPNFEQSVSQQQGLNYEQKTDFINLTKSMSYDENGNALNSNIKSTKQNDNMPFFNELSASDFSKSLGNPSKVDFLPNKLEKRQSIDIEVEVVKNKGTAVFLQQTVPYALNNSTSHKSQIDSVINDSHRFVESNSEQRYTDENPDRQTQDLSENSTSENLFFQNENSDGFVQECEQQSFASEQNSFGQEVELRIVGEVLDTYIIAQYGDEVVFIDKHAAHERILFEALKETDEGCMRQTLIEPIIASVSKDEKQAVIENGTLLNKLGFVVDEFGDNELAIREIPTYMSINAVADAVVQMAARLNAASNELTNNDREWLLHSSACRAAIKAGHKSSAIELLALANDILKSKLPKFCPHGRPVYVTYTKKEIEKQFGRI